MMDDALVDIDFILKLELYHILGADRLAHKAIQEIKKTGDIPYIHRLSRKIENDLFFQQLIKGLGDFYKLESFKFFIKKNEYKESQSNDEKIDHRLDDYDAAIEAFNHACLDLINNNLFSGRFKESSIKLENHDSSDLRSVVESIENFVIFICYRRIVDILDRISMRLVEGDNKQEIEVGLRADNNMKELERFFGIAATIKIDRPEYLPRLRREVSAKLKRFKGEERQAYWEPLYKETQERNRNLKEYYELLYPAVDACITSGARTDEFIGKFLCLLLMKYHVLSHKISERKQYSIFHELRDRKPNQSVGNYALIDSYISYKDELERSRKVFTFVRFMSKYFGEAFHLFGGWKISYIFQALAYLRRGNTYLLQESHEKAFNDFNYAQSFLKNKRKNIELSPESDVYAVVLEAVCLGAKGECYRQDYDYDNAYQYFCQSVTMLEEIPSYFSRNHDNDKNITSKGGGACKGENWNISIDLWKELIDYGLRYNIHIINKAKMFMVKGDFRRAIKWYFRCLRNFYELFAIVLDNEGRGSIEIIGHKPLIDSFNSCIQYLERTKNNAIIQKSPFTVLLCELTGVLDSFIRANGVKMRKECALNGLISDICNRISMLLFVLSLPGKRHPGRHQLADEWLGFSIYYNRYNGLARYNQLICSILEDRKGNSASKIKDRLDPIGYLRLKHDGSLFDRYNRHFATWTLLNVMEDKLAAITTPPKNEECKDEYKGEYKNIAAKLISRMFQYTDNFSLKNKEMFKYLTRERTIGKSSSELSKLYVLRRWSSFSPSIPRPTAFYNRGGGFFIVHRGKGIAIDPGFDFVVNLYQEGFSVNDIDAVLITHDHIDHHSDFDTLLTLWHYNQEMGNRNVKKDVFLSMGLSARYNYLLNQSSYRVYSLRAGGTILPYSDNQIHLYQVEVKAAEHADLSTKEYSVGFVINLHHDNGSATRIGFTGDTRYSEEIMQEYINCDVILFNISSLPFREMKYLLGCTSMGNNDDPYKENLKNVLSTFEKNKDPNADLSLIAKQIYYSYWYEGAKDKALDRLFTDDDFIDNDYKKMELGSHLYLQGILKFNEMLRSEVKKSENDRQKLVIVTELKEEIGSFRYKIAHEINRYNRYPHNLKYLTGDIGMTVQLHKEPESIQSEGSIRVCCTKCKLNNDFLYSDIFHSINEIGEFCVKGEAEGIFYLCKRHDVPLADESMDLEQLSVDEIFYQRVERYNVFGKSSH